MLLRGVGLGCLFLSITLIAFGQLDDAPVAAGIALFNAGRQFGGLIGVAGLQTMIDRDVQANIAVLGAHVAAGAPAVAERLANVTAMLAGKGMEAAAVALLFVVAAPAIVAVKIALARAAKSRAAKEEVLVLPSR